MLVAMFMGYKYLKLNSHQSHQSYENFNNYMALFGLGTIPLMTSAIYLGNFLNAQVRLRIRRAIPVLVVFIGCLFIVRGLELGIPYISPKPITETVDSNYDCHSMGLEINLKQ